MITDASHDILCHSHNDSITICEAVLVAQKNYLHRPP